MADTSQDPLENFVDGIISALFQGGALAAETFAKAEAPFLATPIVSDIFDDIVGLIETSVEKNVALVANAIVFDIQTSGENSAVLKAAQSLQAAQAKGDQSAIEAATQNLINGYKALVGSDGGGISAPTS